jgi:glycosyltransferase involved in cell wall biosynthesis
LISSQQLGILTGLSKEDLAGGLLEVLSHPESAIRMGQSAREYAESEMRWSERTKELEYFYLKMQGRVRKK